MRNVFNAVATINAMLFLYSNAMAQDQVIDASDPTNIYTYMGGGFKYLDYTNGDSMIEVRATGNPGLSESDMILFEFGYRWLGTY